MVALKHWKKLTKHNALNIALIPGHDDQQGNLKAVNLARLGTLRTEVDLETPIADKILSTS